MSLLDQLNKTEGKKPYQSYAIQHGIETISVLVPLKQARAFEERFNVLADAKRNSIVKLVEELGGRLKK